jgi:hypothetical protein
MDKRTVLIMFVVAILAHQGATHQGLEVSTNKDTLVLSPALLETVRIVDADLHTHKDLPSSVDQSIGHEATDAVISGISGALPFQNDGNDLRRYRKNASIYISSQGEAATPLPMRFIR